jgi:hypothetical protein
MLAGYTLMVYLSNPVESLRNSFAFISISVVVITTQPTNIICIIFQIVKLLENNPDGCGMLNHITSDLSTKLAEKSAVRDVIVSIVLY